MSRIRSIKPEFLRNYALYMLEQRINAKRSGPYLNIRTAFSGLWTVADREGRFRWVVEELKLDCLPYDPINFEDVLDALQKHGDPPAIIKYEKDGSFYGWIPQFLKHQRPRPDEAASMLPPPPPLVRLPQPPRIGDGVLPSHPPKPPKESAPNTPEDFSDYRIPFGKLKGVHIMSVAVDECKKYLQSERLSRKCKAALEWRISVKAMEKTGGATLGGLPKLKGIPTK